METKILLVDDEVNLLQGITRQLRGKFNLITAASPEQALKTLDEGNNFAVIVSDMRMPGMNGVELLKRVQKISPLSVRLMLTGNSDQETASRAVNEGNIFRFLNKPCSTEDLTKAFNDAIAQYKLVTAEKDLLQNTLTGSIKVLTDILSMVDPISFERSKELREPVKLMAKELNFENSWDFELGAMLSNIGYVVVPSSLIRKVQTSQTLRPEEEQVLNRVPEVGFSLLSNIPRLEKVAEIVLYQDKNFDGSGPPKKNIKEDSIPIGARVLKVVKDFHYLEPKGANKTQILQIMKARNGHYDPQILKLFEKIFGAIDPSNITKQTQIFEIQPNEFCIGQTLLCDVFTNDGWLLITSGHLITATTLERLKNYEELVGLKKPIYVDSRIPSK